MYLIGIFALVGDEAGTEEQVREFAREVLIDAPIIHPRSGIIAPEPIVRKIPPE